MIFVGILLIMGILCLAVVLTECESKEILVCGIIATLFVFFGAIGLGSVITKRVIMKKLVTAKKVEVVVNKDNNIDYILRDSTMTNTFEYLKNVNW